MPTRNVKFRNGAAGRGYEITETSNARKIERAGDDWVTDLSYELNYRQKKEPGLKDTWKKKRK